MLVRLKKKVRGTLNLPNGRVFRPGDRTPREVSLEEYDRYRHKLEPVKQAPLAEELQEITPEPVVGEIPNVVNTQMQAGEVKRRRGRPPKRRE